MKISFLMLFLTGFVTATTFAQSTFERVYEIFETRCSSASCHDNGSPVLGLDLEGSGAGAMMEVYNNIVNVNPNNVHAAGANNKLIKPGDPARSFLFRKIQNGLDAGLTLHEEEGGLMPQTGGALAEEDIELVRQWILHGAPATGEVIDVALIESFYNNNGIQSIPNPPAKPDPSEGFQLHLGPFFIAPDSENEVFLKHDLMLEEDIEITAVETFMGNQSHHFILNKFLEGQVSICGVPVGNASSDNFADGFRDVNRSSHLSSLFQVGAQSTEFLQLPYRTAFLWEAGTVIDLNSHYINANQNQVLAAELYVNIYTQEAGIAKQELQSLMIPNTSINLPNNGEEITLDFNVPVCFSSGVHIWSLSSHTHELGKDFDIYKSNQNGDNIEHIFDGSCLGDGEPGCGTEFYDYQHPPSRVFDEYYSLTNSDWLKMEAKYINDTDDDVGFGLTSDDEMMIMFLFFVEDTTGLINRAPAASNDAAETNETVPVIIDVLENDNDGDDDIMVIGLSSDPLGGDVVVNADGTLTYTPESGFTGMDQFDYIVCDDQDPPLCDTATVTVNVIPSTGVLENSFSLLNAFPNPTSGNVSLAIGNNQVNTIKLLNIHGQLVSILAYERQHGMVKANLENAKIPLGVYWILIENEDQSQNIAKIIYTK